MLVVDDESTLTDLLSMALRYEDWEVKTAATGQQALAIAREFRPDVVVLDIMLPDIDGLQVLSRMRADGNEAPVLFLTAKDALDDRIARAHRRWRRLRHQAVQPRGARRAPARSHPPFPQPPSPMRATPCSSSATSFSTRTATRCTATAPIELTATEFELLRFLMRNPRRVLSKTQILDRVWSYDFGGSSSVVELYISYLRKKIDSGRTPMIHTVRGAGYMVKAAT